MYVSLLNKALQKRNRKKKPARKQCDENYKNQKIFADYILAREKSMKHIISGCVLSFIQKFYQKHN